MLAVVVLDHFVDGVSCKRSAADYRKMSRVEILSVPRLIRDAGSDASDETKPRTIGDHAHGLADGQAEESIQFSMERPAIRGLRCGSVG